MRREMLEALKALAIGNIKKAKMNIEIYLKSPVGIGEHPDVLGAIQDQIDLIAKEEERLEVIEKYFIDKQSNVLYNSSYEGPTIMKLLTLEDYQKAGETFWPKYWYVAKELGEDAKPEEIIKVMEAVGTVALKLKLEEKLPPFGFNKKKEEETP